MEIESARSNDNSVAQRARMMDERNPKIIVNTNLASLFSNMRNVRATYNATTITTTRTRARIIILGEPLVVSVTKRGTKHYETKGRNIAAM